MQYALIQINDAPFKPMLDAAELYALDKGEDQLTDHEPCDQDEQDLTLTLVYGTYKPQPDMAFPKSEIKRHILADIGHWLVHLNGLETVYLALEDIEPFVDVTLVSSCGHCPKPHVTKDVAFAALNRKGLYALIAPEKRFSKALTKENWRERIDQKRAIKYAQKWR